VRDPVPTLRKADFWTSLVLLAVATGMLLETLTYPLEGSFAGIRNVWYVSPALFPLMVGGMLILLSGLLLVHAIRSGGAAAALADLRGDAFARFWAYSGEFWIVGGVLAGYIYGLIPRIDFVAGTTLLLFTLVAAYHLGHGSAARRALSVYAAAVALVVLTALAGFQPEPRSGAAWLRDALVWGVTALSIAAVWAGVRMEAEPRRKFRHALAVSLVTPILFGAVFKFGLLVPLPYEGLTVEMMDRIRYALRGLS
jgi:hypothetical protein